MEHGVGRSLEDVLEKRTISSFSVDDIRYKRIEGRKRIVLAIAQRLSDLHSINIMHNDLNPGNFLMEVDSSDPRQIRIQIVDFERSILMSVGEVQDPWRNVVTGRNDYISKRQEANVGRDEKLPITFHDEVESFGRLMATVLYGRYCSFVAGVGGEVSKKQQRDEIARYYGPEYLTLIDDILTRPDSYSMTDVVERLGGLLEIEQERRNADDDWRYF